MPVESKRRIKEFQINLPSTSKAERASSNLSRRSSFSDLQSTVWPSVITYVNVRIEAMFCT